MLPKTKSRSSRSDKSKLLSIQLAKAIQGLRDKVPGRAEFNRARVYAIDQMELSLEGTENRVMSPGEHVLGYGSAANPDGSKSKLQRVTPSELRSVARNVLRIDQLTCALVVPCNRPSTIRNWLSAID